VDHRRAVALLVTFVLAEARAEQPIMPLRLFGSRIRTGAYLVRLTYLAAMIGFFFFTTQFLQGVLGFTALQAGLAFLPMTLVNFAVALAIPRLVGRAGNTWPLVAGMLWLSRLTPESDYLTDVALPMLLVGAGQGLAFAPMTTFGIAGASAADAGAASGVVNTFHQVGMSLGLGILVAVAAASDAPGAAPVVALAAEVSAALIGATVLLGLALVLALTLIPPRRRAATTQGGNTSPSHSPVSVPTLEV
jgi:hypothetical protein